MTATTREPCPGCGALFEPQAGPTHRYIEASPACWAMYAAWLVGVPPNADELARSDAPPRPRPTIVGPDGGDVLVMDAYAAQHHGMPSAQAIQSVAVHLLALHGVLTRRVAPQDALWVRQRALRQRGVFQWLAPPSQSRMLTLRHLFPSASADTCTPTEYVVSVHSAWVSAHGVQLDAWYQTFVEGNR